MNKWVGVTHIVYNKNSKVNKHLEYLTNQGKILKFGVIKNSNRYVYCKQIHKKGQSS